jgi:hypothetical protein
VLQDNIYARTYYRNAPTNLLRIDAFVGLISIPALNGTFGREPTRYLTRMTLQGDNLGTTMGVFADESVYIEGAHHLPQGTVQTWIQFSLKCCCMSVWMDHVTGKRASSGSWLPWRKCSSLKVMRFSLFILFLHFLFVSIFSWHLLMRVTEKDFKPCTPESTEQRRNPLMQATMQATV